MQLVDVFLEQRLRTRIVFVDDLTDLFVDRVRSVVRHLLVLGDRAAEEDFTVILAVRQRPEAF